ncbi:MAG: hypothetical protein KatS3mg105_3267 [Gemmatales bacterium]|nr:MAG: hypothetical protein KatS3mg105_3267 [Gemmatales bacterium]
MRKDRTVGATGLTAVGLGDGVNAPSDTMILQIQLNIFILAPERQPSGQFHLLKGW